MQSSRRRSTSTLSHSTRPVSTSDSRSVWGPPARACDGTPTSPGDATRQDLEPLVRGCAARPRGRRLGGRLRAAALRVGRLRQARGVSRAVAVPVRDLTVLRFMLTALVVGGVAIQAGVDLGFTARVPIPPTSMLANVVGGVVFGVGMATAGYCPGTIVAEAGEGRLDAWFAGLSGLVVGAIVFGLLQPTIMPPLSRVGALGRVTFASLSGANPRAGAAGLRSGRRADARPRRPRGEEGRVSDARLRRGRSNTARCRSDRSAGPLVATRRTARAPWGACVGCRGPWR